MTNTSLSNQKSSFCHHGPGFCPLDCLERHPASGFSDRKLWPEPSASGGWDSGAVQSRDSHSKAAVERDGDDSYPWFREGTRLAVSLLFPMTGASSIPKSLQYLTRLVEKIQPVFQMRLPAAPGQSGSRKTPGSMKE